MQKHANAAEFYLHHTKAFAMWFTVLAGQLATDVLSLAPSGPVRTYSFNANCQV